MLVFRVEFRASLLSDRSEWYSHTGPYAGRPPNLGVDAYEWLDELCLEPHPCLSQDERRHPAPWNDRRLKKNLDILDIDFEEKRLCFGFPSLQKLSKWFNSDDRCYLHHCGFICMVYETDTMIPGSKQCVFDINNATPKRFLQLTKIY